jgi:hypothetical protein
MKNVAEQEEEGISTCCGGFDENIVLAVKTLFHQHEMRGLIILRSSNRNNYRYHSRTCPSLAR